MSGKGQAPIKLKTGSSLETEGTAANVATNTAAMEALRSATVDGKDIRPRTTTTEHLSASDAIIHGAFKSGSLMVGGGGVVISSDEDGAEPNTGLLMSDSVFSLIKNGVTQVLFDGETGNASFKGAVYAESGSFPGSLVTGNISVGSGGVTISNDGGASGIYIGGNQIYAKASGVVKFLLNGATGEITASKFNLIADSTSQVTLNQGTHIFGEAIQVGSTTLGGIKNNAEAGASKNKTFYQSYAPTASQTGDIWYDSDDNVLYRWDGSSWTTQSIGTVNHVFAQSSQPYSGMVKGDLWFDTSDGNKMYRYSGYSWVAYQDSGAAAGRTAVQPGGGVAVDGQNYITTIDMANGIVIRSGNATARTQMTSNGIAIYNYSGTCVMQADHSNGVWINNASDTPSVQERLSLAYDSTEKMWIAAVGISGTFYENWICSPSSDLYISAGKKLHLMGYDASYNSCVILRGGPGIYWGSGTPSMSADVGSIYLSTGGSLWFYQTSGWRRIDNWVS